MKSGGSLGHLSNLTELSWQAEWWQAEVACCPSAAKSVGSHPCPALYWALHAAWGRAQYLRGTAVNVAVALTALPSFPPSGCPAVEPVYPFWRRDAATADHGPLFGGAQEDCGLRADGSPCRYLTPSDNTQTTPWEGSPTLLVLLCKVSLVSHPAKQLCTKCLGQDDGICHCGRMWEMAQTVAVLLMIKYQLLKWLVLA